MSQGKPKFAFFKGKIVPIGLAQIGIMTHALHYGTGAFGGLRGYWNPDDEQMYVFRPNDHFTRLLHSANIMRISLPYSPEDLTATLQTLLQTEGFQEDVYIRPIAYKSEELIGVRLHDIEDDFAMFAIPFGRYVANEEGAHVCFSSWDRIDDNAIPARGKITGAYANSALIKSDAILAGFDEALVLNKDGHLAEASAANVFIMRDGQVITPPLNANILEGIVRRSLIHLLREEIGVEVVERNIDRTEIYMADEILMCGTGVQVAAITRVEHRAIGTGKMGPITTQLRDLFFDVVRGKVADYQHWVTPVYIKETAQG